jgi:hypothetical protein
MFSLIAEAKTKNDDTIAPISSVSAPAQGGTLIVDSNEWKEKKAFIEELKRQWKLLWGERIDDKVKAEGIARQDFSLLFVERGTVIIATRDFKQLDFKQILQEHQLVRFENMVSTSPAVGGWGKFAREIFGAKHKTQSRQYSEPKCLRGGQLKKDGKGWLHARL